MAEPSPNRALLPKSEIVGDHERKRESSSSTGKTFSKAKRKLTLSACEPCRRRKIKCDGKRPVCSSCTNKANIHCVWEVPDASLSRTAALRSKVDKLQNQIEKETGNSQKANALIGYLMTRPQREAHGILERLRSSQDIAATVQHVRDGDLLISGVLAPEPGSQDDNR